MLRLYPFAATFLPFQALTPLAVIFLILAVHPLLGRTPFGVLPAVLLGFVEALLVAAVAPMLVPDAPRLNLLWLIGIFAYGCVMTLILVVVENAVLGRMRRTVPGHTGAEPEAGRAVGRGELRDAR